MNIGTMIKKYRHQRDLTQEQLSEYLNVSVSAVSQWESGKTVPDVSTLLSLASFFDITLDELFDRTSNDKAKAIEEYYKLNSEYANRGEVLKQLSLWREATQKYPGDFQCLSSLAHALFSTMYIGMDKNIVESNAKECIAICERILRDCTDNDIRNSAIQSLVYLFSYQEGIWSSEKNTVSFESASWTSEEKAVEYAMMAGSHYVCREDLLEHAYFTEESKGKRLHTKHSNILYYLDQLTMNMYYGEYEDENDKIDACKAALNLWETLIYDNNYLFYHCRIVSIYILLAKSYAKLEKRENTIDSLRKALYHAKCYDNLPKCEQHFTSIFVKSATCDASKTSTNYTGTLEDDIRNHMKNSVFDFIREDAEFLALGE